MAKVEIIVSAIFDGTQTDRQAFIELIKEKNRINIDKTYIDNDRTAMYNEDKVNSDVRQIERI